MKKLFLTLCIFSLLQVFSQADKGEVYYRTSKDGKVVIKDCCTGSKIFATFYEEDGVVNKRELKMVPGTDGAFMYSGSNFHYFIVENKENGYLERFSFPKSYHNNKLFACNGYEILAKDKAVIASKKEEATKLDDDYYRDVSYLYHHMVLAKNAIPAKTEFNFNGSYSSPFYVPVNRKGLVQKSGMFSAKLNFTSQSKNNHHIRLNKLKKIKNIDFYRSNINSNVYIAEGLDANYGARYVLYLGNDGINLLYKSESNPKYLLAFANDGSKLSDEVYQKKYDFVVKELVPGYAKGEYKMLTSLKDLKEDFPKSVVQNKALEQKVLAVIKKHATKNRWKEKFTKVAITTDWTVQAESYGSSIRVGRVIEVAALAKWPDGTCTFQLFEMLSPYSGNGKYSNEVKLHRVTSSQYQTDCK